jgi:crossover junction endodeoxyribonuclease RuvC
VHKPIRILGIDPGTRCTGYGIIDFSSHLRPVDFGAIRPPAKFSLHERYLAIHENLEQIILKYAPDILSVETQFVKKNPQVAIKVGMARGVAILAATRHKVKVVEYAPRKAKQAVVGNGNASKQQVQKMVQILLQLKMVPEPEDAADALALAICHANHLRFEQQMVKKNV